MNLHCLNVVQSTEPDGNAACTESVGTDAGDHLRMPVSVPWLPTAIGSGHPASAMRTVVNIINVLHMVIESETACLSHTYHFFVTLAQRC